MLTLILISQVICGNGSLDRSCVPSLSTWAVKPPIQASLQTTDSRSAPTDAATERKVRNRVFEQELLHLDRLTSPTVVSPPDRTQLYRLRDQQARPQGQSETNLLLQRRVLEQELLRLDRSRNNRLDQKFK